MIYISRNTNGTTRPIAPQITYSLIIQHFYLPIRLLSEESQEAINKDLRNFRERFTKKISGKLTNEDIMSRLLCSSDQIAIKIRIDESICLLYFLCLF